MMQEPREITIYPEELLTKIIDSPYPERVRTQISTMVNELSDQTERVYMAIDFEGDLFFERDRNDEKGYWLYLELSDHYDMSKLVSESNPEYRYNHIVTNFSEVRKTLEIALEILTL